MVIEIAALLIGTLCVVLGYKLLMRGVYPDADAKSVWSDARLLIKRSAPGMMFASFGAAMIVMGLLHGNELHHRAAAAAPQDTQTEETTPAKHSSQAQPVKRKRAGDESGSQGALPQQTEKPDKSNSGDFTRDDGTQPTPAKTFKPGRA